MNMLMIATVIAAIAAVYYAYLHQQDTTAGNVTAAASDKMRAMILGGVAIVLGFLLYRRHAAETSSAGQYSIEF